MSKLSPLEEKLVKAVKSGKLTEADWVGIEKKLKGERGPDIVKTLKKNYLNLSFPWLLRDQDFEKLIGASSIGAKHPKAFLELLKARSFSEETRYEGNKSRLIGGVAVIGITGILFRYSNVCASLFGESSVEQINAQIDTALKDDEVKAILLDVNSPGGEADGINELSDKIFEARKVKPIVTYVSGVGASAGYWLGSSAEWLVMNETAAVGSIGCIVQYEISDTKVETITSTLSPKKAVDIQSDEGRSQIQAHVDTLANIFIRRVSRNRDTSEEVVTHDFGEGDVLFGTQAVKVGMADELGSFETALAKAKNMAGGASNSKPEKESAMSKPNFKKKSGKVQSRSVVFDDEEQEVPEGLEVEELTPEWLDVNEPEMAEAFREEGRQEEAERQEGIEDVEPEDEQEEEMVREAKFKNRSLTGKDLKAQILDHRKAKKAAKVDAAVQDGQDLPDTAANDQSGNAHADAIGQAMEDAAKKVSASKSPLSKK